jgi:hypothetical protein
VHQAAEEDLMADADRIAHLIKCPTCKQRDSAYVRWVYLRVIGWFALGGLFAWVGNIMVPYRITMYVAAIVCGLGGVWQITRERSRYKRAAAARKPNIPASRNPRVAPIVTTARRRSRSARPARAHVPAQGLMWPARRVRSRLWSRRHLRGRVHRAAPRALLCPPSADERATMAAWGTVILVLIGCGRIGSSVRQRADRQQLQL